MSLSTDSPSPFVRGGKIKPRLSQVYVEIARSPLVSHLRQSASVKQNHKENGFPKISMTSTKMSVGKRKNEDATVLSQKKPKLSDMGNVDLPKADAPCHQCRKRKPLTDILRCTRLTKNGSKCKASYCDACLRKNCPRCDGHCSCAICLKKGAVNTSQQDVVHNNTFTVLNQANNDHQVSEVKKFRPQRKKVIPPEPVWVPFLTDCSRKEIEDRLHVREFTVRFNPILNIGVRALEELDDTSSLHDASTKAILLALLDIIAAEEETDVKKIKIKLKVIQGSGFNWSKITHILEELRAFVPQKHPFHSLPIVEKQKDLSYNTRRGRTGFDADSFLPILLHLSNAVCNGGSIRQELEAGEEQARKARSEYYAAIKNANDKWNEQKQGLIDAKPNIQIQFKGMSKAREWGVQYREAEKKHKEKIRDLQSYFRVEINSCASRFEPLGFDMDGRVYYLSSFLGPFRGKKDRLPSDKERLGFRKWGWFIAVYGKPGTQIQTSNNSNDADANVELREEAWWGFADVSEIRKLSKWLLSRAESEDESVLPITAEETSSARSRLNRMKGLVKAINEFADFIDWRLQRSASK